MNSKYKRFGPIKLFIVGFVVATTTSCNSQSVDSCITHYKEARRKLNEYYANSNQSLLKAALREVDMSTSCSETKLGAVELKISLLSLLKDYKKAYQYVSTLSKTDFKASYKKDMYYNYLKSLEYESKADTVNRDSILRQLVIQIQTYIDDAPSNSKLNEEAYYDLFLIRKKFLSTTELHSEIETLINKYPADKQFLDALKSSFTEDTLTASPAI